MRLTATAAATLLLPLLLLTACSTIPPVDDNIDPHLLKQSDDARQARRIAASTPLPKRINLIENDIERELITVDDGRLAPHYLQQTRRGDLRPGPLQIEINAALLSALAARYIATQDEHAKDLGEQIIRGIIAMDARNGELDGHVPFALDPRTLAPSDQPTNSNVYTQLLFAYVIANEAFAPSATKPHPDIQRHVSLIYQRFVNDKFHLRQMDGSRDDRTDLSLGPLAFNARRANDRRLLDAAALHLGDPPTRDLAQKHRWKGTVLAPKHLRLANLEVPTTSSSWLNMLALTALSMLGADTASDVSSLADHYEADNNPFFRVLAALTAPTDSNLRSQQTLQSIRDRLKEFPYPATSSGIINSHRADIKVVRGDYVKFNAFPETRTPLPLYEIGSNPYLWKYRLRKIDSTPEDNPRTLLGYDLYQAYWLLRMVEQQQQQQQQQKQQQQQRSTSRSD